MMVPYRARRAPSAQARATVDPAADGVRLCRVIGHVIIDTGELALQVGDAARIGHLFFEVRAALPGVLRRRHSGMFPWSERAYALPTCKFPVCGHTGGIAANWCQASARQPVLESPASQRNRAVPNRGPPIAPPSDRPPR